MFRDLKEYQEIAKIYADKVSKPEDLEERVRGGGMQSRIKPFEKPSGSAAGSGNMRGGSLRPNPINKPINSGASQGKTKPKPEIKKPMPTTAEIRAANPGKVGGGNAGASTDSGGTSKSTIKSVPVEKEKPEVSTMTKQGNPRTKAQMMAAKRIADGKSISDVKAENQASMKGRAKAKFEAFKKRRAEKKAGMSEGVAIPMVAGGIGKALGAGAAALGAAGMMMQSKKKQGTKGGHGFGGEKPANAEVKAPKKTKKPRLNIGKRASGRDRNFIQGGGAGGMESVEYDAYDLVLEYLLSTEQVATIEEAKYVMIEMDAETIQDIVEEQKKK